MSCLFIATLILLQTPLQAKDSLPEIKVSVVASNTSVKKILRDIEGQSGMKFVYLSNQIDEHRKVSIEAHDTPLPDVLDDLFSGTGVVYEQLDRQILLKRIIASSAEAETETEEIAKIYAISVSGRVIDENGLPLPGVNILVKGTTNGTTTDADGNYTIAVEDGESVLIFSFIGYASQEMKVGTQTQINVTLAPDIKSLQEVVVVGYGTQKAVNLTGSVSSVTAQSIENRPITQSSQALAGLASGVTVTQGSGRPGNDGARIRVRGVGTFYDPGSDRSNDPLVLIDGLAASINDIDPNNIKSMSVLKDAASSAIYGTRAANGVILIETKRGQKGKLQVSYNGYAGWQKVTELPEFVESWEWAQLTGRPAAEVELYRSQSDPDNYPNVPHLRNLLTSGSGFQTNNNIGFRGGDQNNSYFFSLGYLHQDGIVAKNDYDKYNAMLNFDSQIKDNLKLQVSINSYVSDTYEPRQFDGDMMSMINYAVRMGPQYAGKKSDGTYGYQDNYGHERYMDSESFTNNRNKYFQGGAELTWEVFKGFSLSGKAGYNTSDWDNKWYRADVYFNPGKYAGPNRLDVQSGDNALVTLQSLARYTKQIGDHNVNFLLGFSQEEYKDNFMSAFRQSFPNNRLYELDAGSATGQGLQGSASEWGLRSYFGRVNYNFREKYLFEANARYDGTSRFPDGGRWGLFPSISAGWRLSEEAFLDGVTWLDNLKLRASWGTLGNQNVTTYPYQNVLRLAEDYSFGGKLFPGARATTLANPNITWETSEVIDVGLDFSILQGRLDVVFDYFTRTTHDILYDISVSNVLGVTPAPVNAGEVNNRGIELMLNYRASFGALNIGISPNYSYVKNELTKLATVTRDVGRGLFVGQSVNSIYGYVADGLFVNEEDIASYATQPGRPKPGYIRYKDISGPDGVPDGRVTPEHDRTVIGTRFPKHTYGITLTADYKGFDFSMLWQGLAGHDRQMGNYQGFARFNGGQIQRWQADEAWTPENPDRDAGYPILESMGLSHDNLAPSTYWARNAGFFRMKNIQLGYSIPASAIEKLNISKLRLYVSGQNLLTFSDFYPGWDPEMDQAANNNNAPFYPITAVYTFGVNLNF